MRSSRPSGAKMKASERVPVWRWARSCYQVHRSFLLLCLPFVTTRALAIPFLRPGGFFNPFLSDTVHYWSQGRWSAAGAFPYLDYWLEYPPLFPWLVVLAYRISLLLPPWQDTVAWFSLAYHSLLLPFEVGCLVLIYALGRRLYSATVGLQCAIVYALLFVPLFVFVGYLDSLPLFFLLLGLYALLRGWSGGAGVAIGLGMMSKLIPMVCLPAAWRSLRSRSARIRLIVGALLSISIVGLPMLAANPRMTLASLRCMFSRASYESVWAILEGYHAQGVVSYSRFDPSAAGWQVHPSSLPFGWITVAFGLAFVGLYLAWRDRQKLRGIVAFVGLTLNGLMLWSKGFSPQWMAYEIPFVVLLLPGLRGVAYLVAVNVITMSEWVLSYSWMSAHSWFLNAEVILRTVLVAILAAEYATISLCRSGRWAKTIRQAASAVLIVVLIAQGGVWVGGVRAFARDHGREEPHAALAQEIRSLAGRNTGVVFPQVSVFERLYPLMGGVDVHWVANLVEGERGWETEQLLRFVDTHADLWLVTDLGGPEPERGLMIEHWLSERYGKVLTRWVGSAQISRFVTACPSEVQSRQILFDNGLLLVGAGVSGGMAQGFCVRLDWLGETDLGEDYVVFVHLVDDAGRLLAQNDQPPVGGLSPTGHWQAGIRVRDLHGLALGGPLQAGHYQLLLGAYRANGVRLDAFSQAGESLGTQVALADIWVQGDHYGIELVHEDDR